MRLTVRLNDARVVCTHRSHARGWSENPATWDDLKQKYEECAGGVLSQSQVDESLAMIETLDSLPKVKDLMAVLQA
jgi:2-methylcitrate dehydratase PrpD